MCDEFVPVNSEIGSLLCSVEFGMGNILKFVADLPLDAMRRLELLHFTRNCNILVVKRVVEKFKISLLEAGRKRIKREAEESSVLCIVGQSTRTPHAGWRHSHGHSKSH